MRRIKNFVILSLVAFLLGGTIYFSLTVQDSPEVKGVDTQKTGENTLAYVNPPGTNPVTPTLTPTSAPKGGTSVTTVPASPTPTFGTKYENTDPVATATIKLLPTQSGSTVSNPAVTLPVAGLRDDLSKVAAGAGFLILIAFLL